MWKERRLTSSEAGDHCATLTALTLSPPLGPQTTHCLLLPNPLFFPRSSLIKPPARLPLLPPGSAHLLAFKLFSFFPAPERSEFLEPQRPGRTRSRATACPPPGPDLGAAGIAAGKPAARRGRGCVGLGVRPALIFPAAAIHD